MLTFPNAKINLGLNIIEKRPDGYHNLETVFYPVLVEDALEITLLRNHAGKGECVLNLSGKEIGGCTKDNLVVKAYQMLNQDFGLPSVEVNLLKHIPLGAGLGGGSSDAAFMLKMLNEEFGLNLSEEELEGYASRLGADCAFFIRNQPTYAEGIGNIFSPIRLSLKGYCILVVKPDIFVSTKEAYAKIRPRHPKESVTAIVQRPVETWRDTLVNDFEKGIFALHPEIATIKDKLYECGASYASMSGSGSSVFGLFRHEPNEAEIQELFRNCFCQQHKL